MGLKGWPEMDAICRINSDHRLGLRSDDRRHLAQAVTAPRKSVEVELAAAKAEIERLQGIVNSYRRGNHEG